ncbi:type VI secretion system baseplate subunit TssF [Sphingobacterium sp. MYb382]|uniref:type VI secretion system baseplate subunit TssF n=1 Tax=Sphingobacterium sp. MYb382 TaxID=2745278 RepID=UPI0030A98F47
MKEKISVYAKEAIKARMSQNAASIWGLKSVRSLDPFVSLLIDVFATEIFKANNEIHNINARILEKLAKLLTPSIYTYPQPAHAIAYTTSEEAQSVLSNQTEFFVKKVYPSSVKSGGDVQVDVHFTSVGKIDLVNMSTLITVTANTCYLYDKAQNKTPIARVPAQAIRHNKIILGIDATHYSAVKLPEKLTFYCSNPTFEYIDYVFKLLPFVSASNGGHPLQVKPGITYEDSSSTTGYEEIFEEYSMRKQMEDNVKNLYKNKFMEISGFSATAITEEIPEALHFLEEHKETVRFLQGKKIIWIEMEFPPQYSTEILESFSFTLNAFPVYNRKWKSNEYILDIMGDNIPLATEVGEHFLYVDSVEDSHANLYREIPFQQTADNNTKGLYTIRKGGMERFNERNALEMIANVLELTRDEVSAFGALGRDKVMETLREMTSQMRGMEQKVTHAERMATQEINYVIVNPHENIENLRSTYWVTHCGLANNIRIGTTLVKPKMADVKDEKQIVLLTNTSGGTEEQQGTNAIQAYKYALTTRDKLISIEDIKNYCRLVLKNDVKSVEVKRGTIISSKPKEGFVRTIEVEIVPNAYEYLGDKYWGDFSDTLKYQIMLRGIDGIEYIVRVKNEDHA